MEVVWEDCPVCHGACVWLVNEKLVICTRCSGTGKVKTIT